MNNIAMTRSMQRAFDWLVEHDGDAAVAKCVNGGRIYLAKGEVGPFMPQTAQKLIDAGLAEYVTVNGRKNARFRLF